MNVAYPPTQPQPAEPWAVTGCTPDAEGAARPAPAGAAVDDPVRAAVEAAVAYPWQVGSAAGVVDLVFVGAITPTAPGILEVELRLRLRVADGSSVWLRLALPVHSSLAGRPRAADR